VKFKVCMFRVNDGNYTFDMCSSKDALLLTRIECAFS
jgi:hypothetical protein